MSLSPESVRSVVFDKAPLGKRGYHEGQVDDFLDRVEATLSGRDDLTAHDVRRVMFDTAPLIKRGYHEDQVDAFLDQVAGALTELEQEVEEEPPAPELPPADDISTRETVALNRRTGATDYPRDDFDAARPAQDEQGWDRTEAGYPQAGPGSGQAGPGQRSGPRFSQPQSGHLPIPGREQPSGQFPAPGREQPSGQHPLPGQHPVPGRDQSSGQHPAPQRGQSSGRHPVPGRGPGQQSSGRYPVPDPHGRPPGHGSGRHPVPGQPVDERVTTGSDVLFLPLPPAPPGVRGYRPGDVERLARALFHAATSYDGRPTAAEIADFRLTLTFFAGQGYHPGAVDALIDVWVNELRHRES